VDCEPRGIPRAKTGSPHCTIQNLVSNTLMVIRVYSMFPPSMKFQTADDVPEIPRLCNRVTTSCYIFSIFHRRFNTCHDGKDDRELNRYDTALSLNPPRLFIASPTRDCEQATLVMQLGRQASAR